MRVDQLIDYKRELVTRKIELTRLFEEWEPRGGDVSFNWYKRYVSSGYVALPFPGGFASQPTWWLDDVDMFELQASIYDIPDLLKSIDQHIEGMRTGG